MIRLPVSPLIDNRPMCDHSTWSGNCSIEKHNLLLNGKANESFEIKFKRALNSTRQIINGVVCSCCGVKLW